MSPGIFRNEISRARTFGFMSDVESLWKAGLALGANLNNTIAIGENKIMNREGLRYPQEFVRHKMLDAVGDLALAGKPLLAAYRSVRGGHRLNSHGAAGAVRRYGGVDRRPGAARARAGSGRHGLRIAAGRIITTRSDFASRPAPRSRPRSFPGCHTASQEARRPSEKPNNNHNHRLAKELVRTAPS